MYDIIKKQSQKGYTKVKIQRETGINITKLQEGELNDKNYKDNNIIYYFGIACYDYGSKRFSG